MHENFKILSFLPSKRIILEKIMQSIYNKGYISGTEMMDFRNSGRKLNELL